MTADLVNRLAQHRALAGAPVAELEWLASHGVQIQVMQDARCIALMREFMQRHPALWAEDIGE